MLQIIDPDRWPLIGAGDIVTITDPYQHAGAPAQQLTFDLST